MFRRPIKGLLNHATLHEVGCRLPDSSAIHWLVLPSCRKMSKSAGKRLPERRESKTMGTSGSKRVRSSETPIGEKREAVRVWMLGGFRVSVGSTTIPQDAWRLRKAANLVKLLALSPFHRLHREQVMDALWPGLGIQAASNNLRQTLHAARRTLEPDRGANARYLSVQEKQLTLCPRGRLWVDVEVFEEAAATARRVRDPAAYRLAIEMYAGELLPGDRYEEWAEGRREELRRLYLELLVELAGLCEERDEHEAAVGALRRVATEDPTQEEA